jgi:hypothetical protein
VRALAAMAAPILFVLVALAFDGSAFALERSIGIGPASGHFERAGRLADSGRREAACAMFRLEHHRDGRCVGRAAFVSVDDANGRPNLCKTPAIKDEFIARNVDSERPILSCTGQEQSTPSADKCFYVVWVTCKGTAQRGHEKDVQSLWVRDANVVGDHRLNDKLSPVWLSILGDRSSAVPQCHHNADMRASLIEEQGLRDLHGIVKRHPRPLRSLFRPHYAELAAESIPLEKSGNEGQNTSPRDYPSRTGDGFGVPIFTRMLGAILCLFGFLILGIPFRQEPLFKVAEKSRAHVSMNVLACVFAPYLMLHGLFLATIGMWGLQYLTIP